MTAPPHLASRFGLVRMRPRDPDEPHRSASPLELFFDLVFVVSVAIASRNLHHFESEGHVVEGVGPYLAIFFAIWWAWMNFTWFATSFDTDDWLYRLTTIVQMGGALLVAAGAEAAMTQGDFGLTILGYIVMRLVTVGQWLRAAAGSVEHRATALRFAVGIPAVQLLWVGWWLGVPDEFKALGFVLLAMAELAIPVWAERASKTPWHPHHITERYGLFTLILLGESILASANAIIDAIHHTAEIGPLLTIAVTALVLAAGMWWVYFARPQHDRLETLRGSVLFGYVHYVIFAAAGAFSAGIEVAIDHDTNQTDLDSVVAAATATVPVALFVIGIWSLALRRVLPRWANVVVVVLGVAIALAALGPYSFVVAAVGMVVIVLVLEVTRPPKAS
ncbi:low temperature requirement protein LtrA [Diaminobutyricimonas aerilata]|uniref:Low temperature requirement protein LtrA n=1 Tax=Diaminobutyricimonas aerilata TaxID=1162967 RepID=A0A2M9CHV5_9MICO|nr:low temperature requirement protein A [Diaminobutyricimonas aerilata]PJJ71468.1 low temperature requirement protein LtrA [Diaminobutyricimonas aerilata]